MTGWQARPLTVPADHPTAAGHFPGRPVIPGALLLDEAMRAIGLAGPLTLRAVKFLAPVPHGVALTLRWQSAAPGRLRFEIIRPDRNDTPVLAGTLEEAA